MTLRSDEIASQSMIEKHRRSEQNVKSGLKTTASIGSAVVGAGMSAKILPFLSEYLTPDLALKGLKKVSPKLGNFLESGIKNGLNLKDGIDFLKQNVSPVQQQPQQDQNIIQQYSPELFQFMEQEISGGRQPIQAAEIAQNDPKFKNIIDKLMKDHKTTWSSIVEQVFGKEPMAMQQPQQAPQQPQAQQPVAQPQQGQQIGPGQQALMQTLQRINQKLGG